MAASNLCDANGLAVRGYVLQRGDAMFKKLILAAGLLAAGTMLLTKTHIGAYSRAMVGWAKHTVVGNIPLEADIMAAKQLLADMDGKIENAARTVARERVEVRKL